MKIELFEQRIKSRRSYPGYESNKAQHNIYYTISQNGLPDANIGLLQYNYCGDYDFSPAVNSYNSKPSGSSFSQKKFKPTLTKKDFEDCARILKFWRSKDIFVPGANCLTNHHCYLGNIYFSELIASDWSLERSHKIPIERYFVEKCDLKEGENDISKLISKMKAVYDTVSQKVLITIHEEIPQEQVRLILFVNNWINLQEKKYSKEKIKKEIQEMESRIKRAEDALRDHNNINEMKAALDNLKGKL